MKYLTSSILFLAAASCTTAVPTPEPAALAAGALGPVIGFFALRASSKDADDTGSRWNPYRDVDAFRSNNINDAPLSVEAQMALQAQSQPVSPKKLTMSKQTTPEDLARLTLSEPEIVSRLKAAQLQGSHSQYSGLSTVKETNAGSATDTEQWAQEQPDAAATETPEPRPQGIAARPAVAQMNSVAMAMAMDSPLVV